MMAERVSAIWRTATNVVPGGATFEKWVDAPNDALEWVVSGSAAGPEELNIPLSPSVPRI